MTEYWSGFVCGWLICQAVIYLSERHASRQADEARGAWLVERDVNKWHWRGE